MTVGGGFVETFVDAIGVLVVVGACGVAGGARAMLVCGACR